MAESNFKSQLLLELSSKPDWLVKNSPTGLFKNIHGHGYTQVGISGQPDVDGVHKIIVTPDMVGREIAIYVGIETKDLKGKQRETQAIYQRNLEKLNACYILAKQMSDVYNGINRYITGENIYGKKN